jgi:HlyD family secretion protein
MRLTKKTGIWILVAVVAIACMGVGWRVLTAKRSAAAQASRIITAKVERGDLEVRVSGTGSVEAASEEEVRARMSGTISEFAMKDGQQVEAGQVLALLETKDLSLQIERARLDIDIQERALEKLRKEKVFDTIQSPGNGEITWNIKEGDRVQEDGVIATIQDRSRLEVIGSFNSTQVQNIKPGQEADVLVEELLRTLPAKVIEVSNVSRSGKSGTILYDVRAQIDNPGGLSEGVLSRLTVHTPSGDQQAIEYSTTSLPEPAYVRSTITGKVVSLLVESGDGVTIGQKLAEIGDSDGADQLTDQIINAELRLKQARLDLQDLEQQQTERVQNSQVTAPISGTVVLPSKPSGIGDDISQGTVLGTVVDYSSMKVVIPVDELDVAKVKIGQKAKITADALPGVSIDGEVTNVASHGVSQSGVATFDISIAIKPVEGLKVGMTVNADVLVESRKNTLFVPIEAVQQQGGRSVVRVIEKRTDGIQDARPIQVKTGVYDSSRMEILEGLKEGQEIMIQGGMRNSNQQQRGPVPMPGMGVRIQRGG